jgi:hypothetical protein
VLAHEMIHELGYPDGRQPHPCPGDSGHVCDSTSDLLYPYLSAGVSSLDQLVLDVGRDDYYRGGTATDLSASQWLRHLEAPQQPLTVSVSGTGAVTSDLPGVVCAASCTSQWDVGSRVVLAALPGPGQRFVGWKGACTGPDCSLTLTAPLSVEAVFAPVLTAKAAVVGKGRVTGHGLSCPTTCSASIGAGFPLVLTAKPVVGWRFAGWVGACSGTKLRCTVVPEANVSVRARFVKR